MRTDQLVAGRYRLLRLIAVGGMGEVWEAADSRLARHVAVKLLKPGYGDQPTFLARFRAEARHAAGLAHPGIAAVYDYGETDQHVYLVMELVEGEPLSQLIAREAPLAPALALQIVGQTGLALQAAHDAGVIHRDIKPGNLLVVRDNRADPSAVTVKVTDFGIARAVDSAPLTRTGMVMGTAHYLSPEQARAGTITTASDVYSLGVVAYECLTGARPFTGDTAFAIAAGHAREVPPALPRTLPAPVRALVEQAMAKDPADRPASAGTFGRAALALAAGDLPAGAAPATRLLPAVASPPTELLAQQAAPPRARRRHPIWPWFVALLVAAVAAVAAYELSPAAPVKAQGQLSRAYNEAASARPQLGLAPAPASVTTGGPAGTVAGVAADRPLHRFAPGRSGTTAHGKDTGGNGG